MNYELIKKNYDRGLWNKRQVEIAKEKGIITQKEYDDLKIMKQKNVQLYADLYKNVAFHVIMSTDVSK